VLLPWDHNGKDALGAPRFAIFDTLVSVTFREYTVTFVMLARGFLMTPHIVERYE